MLALKASVSEPTGVLLNKALARTDHLPLSASLVGEGPLARWQGRLEVSAGQVASFDSEVRIAAARDTIVSLDGTAALAALLPSDMAAGIGDAVSIAGTLTSRKTAPSRLTACRYGRGPAA